MFRRTSQSPKSPGLAFGPFVTTWLVTICACPDGITAKKAAAKARLITVFIMTQGPPFGDELSMLNSVIPRCTAGCLDNRQHLQSFPQGNLSAGSSLIELEQN